MGSGARERKPITTRLREIMRNSLAAGEGADITKWELCVDAPTDKFSEECSMIDTAYATLETLYETALSVNDKQDDQYTQLKRERDAIAAELDRVQGETPDMSCYVKLPVDADGVPWHIGDRTESGQTVGAMGLNKHGWCFNGTVNEIDPSIHRHYHEPTVEDVLRDMCLEIDRRCERGSIDYDELFAEYADKLREVMRDGRD